MRHLVEGVSTMGTTLTTALALRTAQEAIRRDLRRPSAAAVQRSVKRHVGLPRSAARDLRARLLDAVALGRAMDLHEMGGAEFRKRVRNLHDDVKRAAATLDLPGVREYVRHFVADDVDEAARVLHTLSRFTTEFSTSANLRRPVLREGKGTPPSYETTMPCRALISWWIARQPWDALKPAPERMIAIATDVFPALHDREVYNPRSTLRAVWADLVSAVSSSS